MASDLLLEIGTEEIPSGYLQGALEAFAGLAESALKEARVRVEGKFSTCGTPRRLVLMGSGIAENQDDQVLEVTGPPRKVAFDAEGNPTKAALGFAAKQGITVEEIGFIETPKGEYLFCRRVVPGRPTLEILSEILPGIISSIPWPKSMRWGSLDFAFARPIHWIVALFGGKVVPFETAGVRSGDETRGHRFMAPEPRRVKDTEDYLQAMRELHVQVDPAQRERTVWEIARQAAKSVGGVPSEDPGLVSTVANLVEKPSAVCGGFEDRFLDLPDVVLITAMREHQKYFAVYDQEGRLMPHFVAVNNTEARNEQVVRRGHERVLRARLSDAEFFFKEDRKRALADRLEDLKEVIYQAELGTSFDKVERFTALAEWLAREILPERVEEVGQVARLCKCDLVTQMVDEFPSLQGAIGREYALLEGYPGAICDGIRDHYRPARAEDALPASDLGAVVGLADRMDTIAGCFAIGQEPTGTADPYALRRNALAVLRILEDRAWTVGLVGFIHKSLELLSAKLTVDMENTATAVLAFFRERYKQMMLRGGYETELVEAVISAGFDRVDSLRSRIEQLKRFKEDSAVFEPLALTAKRVNNILKKQVQPLKVDEDLFREPCETVLWQAYLKLQGQVADLMEQGSYGEALMKLSGLQKPVDDFFEGVEILTKESEALRNNRVAVLQSLQGLFMGVADFSKFAL